MKKVAVLVALMALGSLAAPSPADPRLDAKVTYSNPKISVQYLVMELAHQAGLKYDFKKSLAQTDPECRLWLRDVSIKNKPCRQALEKVLKPVGLRYEVENDTVVLYRR